MSGVHRMTDDTPPDALDVDPDREWPAEVGRDLLAYRLFGTRDDVDAVIQRILDRLYAGGDPTEEDIHAAREALDELRHDIEEFAAPVAGVEPWDDGVNARAPKWAMQSRGDRDVATDGGERADR